MAGRPKGSSSKKKVIVKKDCMKCKRSQEINANYYNSNSPLFEDKKSPICKKCINDYVDVNDIQTVHTILQQIDLPFDAYTWQTAVNSKHNTLGTYFRLINSLPQFQGRTWKDSVFSDNKKRNEQKVSDENVALAETKSSFKFKITEEIITRWGQNYELDDYMKLEDFYQKMKDMNRIETPQEETYLKKLAVISLKMDQELEAGNYGQVKQLGDLFSKYMSDSKFRAADKSEADKTGGIRNFGTIFAEVEKDDHIPPWEYYRKLKGLKQDIVDQTIMHIENFTLRLNKIERMIEPPVDTPKVDESGDVL